MKSSPNKQLANAISISGIHNYNAYLKCRVKYFFIYSNYYLKNSFFTASKAGKSLWCHIANTTGPFKSMSPGLLLTVKIIRITISFIKETNNLWIVELKLTVGKS